MNYYEDDESDLCDNQCEGHNYIFAVAPEAVEKTPEIHEPGHPHHAVWREYTESLLAGKPKQLEYRTKRPDDFWRDSDMSTSWHTDIEYRIKPESKLFWYLKGEKIVEYVERVAIQERSQLEIQIDGVKISSKSFTTYFESRAVAHKLGEIFETLELKY